MRSGRRRCGASGPGRTRHTGGVVTRPLPGTIPDAPGSYQFLDRDGRVLYVGKAKSLRQRLNSYFQDPGGLAPRTAQLVQQADHVEWMVVDSESEALLLEHNLIKQLQPRYNVRLKDDKSYPWLALTVNDEWPRPAVVRGRKRSGVRYFGPYPNVGAIRETLDLLLRSFPVRTCSDTKFRRHERLGRPCLLFHIERCSGPCVGEVDHDEYARLVADVISFLSGDTGSLVRGLEASMKEASRSLDYERARVLRGQARGRSGRGRRPPDGAGQVARTSTCSGWPRTSWRRRCRCSMCARARWWAGSGCSWTRSRTSRRDSSWSGSWSTSTPTRPPASPARCWCRPCRRTATPWRPTSPSGGRDRSP